MSISIGFHVSCRFKKSENFIKSLYNIFIYFSRFFKILIRCLVDERCSDKPTLSTKIHVTSSVLHQILSNKMVKITRNKRYEHGKLKTGTWHLNKQEQNKVEKSVYLNMWFSHIWPFMVVFYHMIYVGFNKIYATSSVLH